MDYELIEPLCIPVCCLDVRARGYVIRLNSSPPGQNGRHFADDVFKRIFLNENIWISNKISLEYVHWGLNYNMSALVQILAWRQAIIWTNADPVHRRVYTALGREELKQERLVYIYHERLWWRIKCGIIGFSNGLVPIWSQPIISSKLACRQWDPWEKISLLWIIMQTYLSRNSSFLEIDQHIIYKMAIFLARRQFLSAERFFWRLAILLGFWDPPTPYSGRVTHICVGK